MRVGWSGAQAAGEFGDSGEGALAPWVFGEVDLGRLTGRFLYMEA